MNQFDRQTPGLWKLGMFYFNRKDADFVVPKITGLGWTVNFAHPRSWVFMGLIVTAIIVAVVYFQ